jgi:hypothetical protein
MKKLTKYLVSIDGMDSDIYYDAQKTINAIRVAIENKAKKIVIQIKDLD